MFRLGGVVHNLVDVVRIRSPQEYDVRLPFPQVRGDFDHLVLPLRVGVAPFVPHHDFPCQKSFVPVVLRVQGPALQPVRLFNDFIQDLLHVPVPEPAVQVDRVASPPGTGESGIVPPAVGGVDVGDPVGQQLLVVRNTGADSKYASSEAICFSS